MKPRKSRRRFGTMLFFIPIVLILLLVVYGVLSSHYLGSGTLIVSAQTSDRYYQPLGLNVTAQVGTSHTGATPLHLQLATGTYLVQFSQVPWFYTPLERSINMVPGQTEYAVGVYDPIVRIVVVSNNEFNSSRMTAEHSITPVIFVNQMKSYVLIQSGPIGRVNIPPSGNFTYVFTTPGTYPVYLVDGTAAVTVSVS